VLTRMEVESALPGAPAIPLGGFMPNNDPVQIRKIDGLGPVKSDVASTPFATGRGELYQGSSTGKRNIVLTLGLNPNWVNQTMSSLRQLLYRYFMPETWAKLRFITDDLPTVYINGVVESFEPNIFEQDPEIQVSILCPKPDFIDVNATLIYGATDPTATTLIEYIGTTPTGFELVIESAPALGSYSGEIVVSNVVGPYAQRFAAQSVVVNPTLYFRMNTARSTRYIRSVAVSSGSMINILEKMEAASSWPEFNPGDNTFSVKTAPAGLKWSLGYFNRFGGL
jgi:hypothetical protein